MGVRIEEIMFPFAANTVSCDALCGGCGRVKEEVLAVGDLGFVRYRFRYVTLNGLRQRLSFASQERTKGFDGEWFQIEIQGFVRLQKSGETSDAGLTLVANTAGSSGESFGFQCEASLGLGRM